MKSSALRPFHPRERAYRHARHVGHARGGETCTARLSFVRAKRRKLPHPHVSTIDGDVLRPHEQTADRIDYLVPADGRLILRWED